MGFLPAPLRGYSVMPRRARSKQRMALPRMNFQISSVSMPACVTMSVATFSLCGKVESAWG